MNHCSISDASRHRSRTAHSGFRAACAILVTGLVSVAQGSGTYPTELPEGPDKELVQRMCTGCHTVDVVVAHRDTRDGWAAVVDNMIVMGARAGEGEAERVVNYLARHFSQTGEAPPVARTTAPEPDVRFLSESPGAKQGTVSPSAPDSPTRQKAADWRFLGHDPASSRYSPLRQIDTANVGDLEVAWQYEMRTAGGRTATVDRPRRAQLSPLIVDGVMFITNPYGGAAALESDTGAEIWWHELPAEQGFPALRSLAYWNPEGAAEPTLYFATTGGFLVALNARTGKPVSSFAENGALDLKAGMLDEFPNASYGLTSPPMIHDGILITGSRTQERPALGPSGAIRAWDARTGEQLWTFNTIPQPGEANHDTWAGDTWKNRSGANNWGLMTVDAETDTVFIPLGTVTFDYYGGDRPGTNLYGDSLVALDIATGELKWYYQTVHHDVWDYDLNAAPVLVTVEKNGKPIPAVAQVTKQSLLFVLDRATGEPIHAVEEKPVPQEGFYEGEVPWPTQPHPVVTPPLARADFDPSEIARITPEHTRFCESMLQNGRSEPRAPAGEGGLRSGPLYTPFNENGTIMFPGTLGGVNWYGMSYDPNLGYLFAATMSLGEVFQTVIEPGSDTLPSPLRYKFWDEEKMWPCSAPPWGELVAVDVNTGKIAWRRPLGSYAALEELGIMDAGTPVMGGPISTAGGVTFVGGTLDNKFRAFASENGEELWSVDVGAASHNIPVTYLARDGRQYVAVVVSGGGYLGDPVIPPVLFVYGLPDAQDLPAASN